jgi:hypothetical protein
MLSMTVYPFSGEALWCVPPYLCPGTAHRPFPFFSVLFSTMVVAPFMDVPEVGVSVPGGVRLRKPHMKRRRGESIPVYRA